MIKYLKYELKKNLWLFGLLTAVCLVPYVAHMSTFTFWVGPTEDRYLNSTGLTNMTFELIVLCYLAPLFVYSFKMNKRSVDAFYSLPLKREKLYFVKTLVGLFLVLIPFTLTYWSGFLALLCRPENPYYMSWYVPAYFGALFLGTCIYGMSAFVYTRANNVGDGVVFLVAYSFVGILILEYIEMLIHTSMPWWLTDNFTFWGAISQFGNNIGILIKGGTPNRWSVAMFIIPFLLGGIGYFLLFYTLRFEKGESAEQCSDSWYGYRVLLPLFIALIVAINNFSLLNRVMTLICGIVVTVVWRHTLKFSWKYWVTLVGAVVLGILLGMLVDWTAPIVNPPSQAFGVLQALFAL